MQNLQIKKAESAELKAISIIYDRVIDYLEQPEHILYANWRHEIYPTEDSAREHLEKGELFTVCVDGEVAATFILNSEGAPEYSEIDWGLNLRQDETVVLHTLAVNPDKMNCGIGKIVMAYIEGYARSNGYRAIRLDTSEGNIPGNRLYSGAGYTLVGKTALEPQFRKNRLYNCYQRIIKK